MGVAGTFWLSGLLCVAVQLVNPAGGAVFHDGGDHGTVPVGTKSSVCLDCHQFPDRLTHPIGVPVQKVVELPLGAGGTVECATCHDPGKHKTEGIRGAALRLPAPDLCRVCHEESRKMTRAEHGIVMGRAHFTNTGVRLVSHGIDEVTRECLGCHDGSVAGERGSGMSIGPNNSHPVGRLYDEHSRSGRNSRLRPRSALPPEVQLVGDTVGCQSCHSPFSHEADMVTRPMRDSALCCTCHEM